MQFISYLLRIEQHCLQNVRKKYYAKSYNSRSGELEFFFIYTIRLEFQLKLQLFVSRNNKYFTNLCSELLLTAIRIYFNINGAFHLMQCFISIMLIISDGIKKYEFFFSSLICCYVIYTFYISHSQDNNNKFKIILNPLETMLFLKYLSAFLFAKNHEKYLVKEIEKDVKPLQILILI